MKCETIKLSQLENTLKLVELQRELVVRLTLLKEGQELQLKRQRELIIVAKNINKLKFTTSKSVFKLDNETRKEVNKLLKDRSLFI